jgi:hypothetical protein
MDMNVQASLSGEALVAMLTLVRFLFSVHPNVFGENCRRKALLRAIGALAQLGG